MKAEHRMGRKGILAVPGLGFAELGPGDFGLSLGYVAVPREPYPPEMRQARERVVAACRGNGQTGRAHPRRSMPV